MSERDRGEILLGFVYDEADDLLNPDGSECWHCGGDGETFDCIDGCCVDAEAGCPTCATPCPECKIHAAQRAKLVRQAVIKSGDIDLAKAWLKESGRLTNNVTDDMIRDQLITAAAAEIPPRPDD